MARYGAKSNLGAESNKEKQRNTLIARYGVDNFSKTAEFKSKYKDTCMDRYGVDNASKSPAVKKQIDKTHRERYGRVRQSQVHIPDFIIDTKSDKDLMEYWFNELKMPVTEIADRLGVSNSQLCVHFKNTLGIDISRHSVSVVEREVGNYLCSLGVAIEQSNRTIIAPKELDILVPSCNLAVEVHGLAWHCELRGKGKDYHVEKMKGCNKQGIRLVQILDHEWANKQEIVKSRLSTFVGANSVVYARRCQIVTVSAKEASDFFEKNHIQGSCVSRVAYGLTHNDELVALMSFGMSRFNKAFQWELMRFSSALFTSVVGGASKLFAHFKKQHNPESIVSYCDLRWNTGNLYTQLGFEKVRESGPNQWYTKGYRTLESRMRYQKHKLASVLESFDPALTAWENMVASGYDRFWDCGNAVYAITRAE